MIIERTRPRRGSHLPRQAADIHSKTAEGSPCFHVRLLCRTAHEQDSVSIVPTKNKFVATGL